MIREKNSRMSLCVQELFIHKILPEFLQSFRDFGMIQVSPFLLWSISLLCLRILVGLDDGLSRACSSGLSHSIDTGMGFESVLSCEDDVGDDESDELDEEDVVDKPGDLDRYVVFRITLYVNTVFNETWSSIMVHSYAYPWSSQRFPSNSTADVSSRIFSVKNISNSLT